MNGPKGSKGSQTEATDGRNSATHQIDRASQFQSSKRSIWSYLIRCFREETEKEVVIKLVDPTGDDTKERIKIWLNQSNSSMQNLGIEKDTPSSHLTPNAASDNDCEKKNLARKTGLEKDNQSSHSNTKLVPDNVSKRGNYEAKNLKCSQIPQTKKRSTIKETNSCQDKTSRSVPSGNYFGFFSMPLIQTNLNQQLANQDPSGVKPSTHSAEEPPSANAQPWFDGNFNVARLLCSSARK